MDDLFEQLKNSPAVNKNVKVPPTRTFLSPLPLDDYEIEEITKIAPRRESLPSNSSTSINLKKIKSKKSRSLSPPKNCTKPLKVVLERKKFNDIIKKNNENQKKSANKTSSSKIIADAYREIFKSPDKSIKKSLIKEDDLKKDHGLEKKVKADKAIKLTVRIEKSVQGDKTLKLKPTNLEKTSKVDKLNKSTNKSDKSIIPVEKLIKVDKTAKSYIADKAVKSDIVDKVDKSGKADKILENLSPKKLNLNNSSVICGNPSNNNSAPKKVTPTKAQKKQFAPCESLPLYENLNIPQQLKKQNHVYKIKRCVVRLPRQNLKNLQKKFLKMKSKNGNIPSEKNQTKETNKRKSSEKNSPSPTKRVKESNTKKEPTGFFIKLSSPSLKGQNKKNLTKKPEIKNRVILTNKISKHGLPSQIVKAPSSSTKPTKFTRTQLIKQFGKRFFKSHVKIEKCNHPLMLIFESNARARKLKAKRNKSKNLSVSFKDQVEIFGCTDSEDYDSSDAGSDFEYKPKGTSSRKTASANPVTNKSASSATSLTPLPATPARLKKVENGKVVDDIELDPALFLDPSVVGMSSTPYGHSPGRKKREKKSFSPLKGDATPSPRKEQFKLANEKMPPSGLRRINIDDVDDEDDEDDDCEYIVPIEIPQRRSSGTAVESSSSFASATGDRTLDSGSTTQTHENPRLDAPMPDNLELDAPTPEGIELMIGEDDSSSRFSLSENDKNTLAETTKNCENASIFTPISNNCATTSPLQTNDTAETAEHCSLTALNVSTESETSKEGNATPQSLEQNLETARDEEEETLKNAKDNNEDKNAIEGEDTAAVATETNGNGPIVSAKDNDTYDENKSLTMSVKDTPNEN